MTSTLTIDTLDGTGSFNAYCAAPAGPPRAAIIVIQEIFGVNAGIRRKCDRLAADGYLAIAPDLFWRLEPGIELDPDVPEQFRQALDWMGKFNQDAGVRDIEATIRAARARLGEGGKVGAVGYCLGGRLAFMTATRTDVSASVVLLRRRHRWPAGREACDRASGAAPHPRGRSFRRQGGAAAHACRAGRPPQGDIVRLSGRRSRLRDRNRQAAISGCRRPC